MSDKHLILVAHGSRRVESNDEVRRLTATLHAKARRRFGGVSYAFLELEHPSIVEAIDAAVANGAREVIVLPYFLAAGRHVVEDIPREVETKQRQYPEVKFRIAPYLGTMDGIADLLLAAVN